MFAVRGDQENLAYSHQTTAAAKPLNQGIKGLESKTPGPKAPKTPFRGNRNDENTIQFGKTGLKTGGKVKQDAFVTPAGPRSRAPLGMKTTNVKGAAFQTPAPLTHGKDAIKSTQKPVSPRLRRGKVRIHQAESTTAEADSSDLDIEYMPPRSNPLADHPDDIHELDISRIFDPKTLVHDSARAEAHRVSEQSARRFAASREQYLTRAAKEGLARDPYMAYGDAELTALRTQLLAADAEAAALSSKSAASALSKPAPRFAAPTASTKARGALAPKSTNGNHAAAAAASRSTLGYAKGRVVSASKRPGLSNAHKAPVVRKVSVPEDKTVMQRLAEEEERKAELRAAGLGRLVDDQEDSDDGLEEMLRKGFGLDDVRLEGDDEQALQDFVLE